MKSVYIDAETYSEVELRMIDGGVGTYAYAAHPTTIPILWSIHLDDLVRPLVFEDPDLFAILDMLVETKHITYPVELVHWGVFDREVVRCFYGVGFGLEQETPSGVVRFRDLREQSLLFGGPGILEHAAEFWAGVKKDTGTDLIKRFCKPPRIHPSKDPVRWEKFRSYAQQDTAVLLPIDKAMQAAEGGPDLAKHEPASSMIRRMNERGVPVDMRSIETSIELLERQQEFAVGRCEELCGLRPTQLKKLGEWLGLPNMQAPTVQEFIKTATGEKKEVAELQQSVAGAAVKKLYVMRRMANPRVQGCFSYHGAHTRRLTSHDLQLQNFVRAACDPNFFEWLYAGVYGKSPVEEMLGSPKIFSTVRQNIRGYIKTDQRFVAADYSAVECRVLNWLSGEQWVLDLFADGGDPYVPMAAKFFHVEDVTSDQRQVGKVGELSLGFQGGAQAVINGAKSYGLDMSYADANDMKQIYRSTHGRVVSFWEKCEVAMRAAIEGQKCLVNGKVWFEPFPWYVRVRRPSGFAQYFWHPKIVEGHWPDGGVKEEIEYTGRSKSGAMVQMTTYGGDIAQGITQGTAADLMLEGMMRVEEAGIDPVLSVHDEGVFEVTDEWEGDVLQHVCDLMAVSPAWAEGLPIAADGWIGRRFTK